MRTLRICNSADLPAYSERDSSYVYYTYDNMEIFIGKNRYYDHYCIVDTIPDSPIEHMMYITMDGDIKVCIDNTITDFATIESEDQLEYLTLVGTTFFMKAEYRYLDLQTRTIQLPYQNGTYMLSTSMANDIIIDKDTVISYDESLGHFVIDGNLENSEELRRISQYKGSSSDTADTTIDDNTKRITTDVKISEKYYNIIQLMGDGLYASTEGLATSDEVHQLANTYYNFKTQMLYYIEEIKEALEGIESISEDSINAKILAALEDYVPTAESVVANYEVMYQQLGILTQSIQDYADEKFDELSQEIADYFTNLNIEWENFTGDEEESEADTAYSDTEVEVRNMIMEEYNAQLLVLRLRESDDVRDVLFSIITDEDWFDDVSYSNTTNCLTVTSTAGSEYKYTALTVSPELEDETHRYFYAVDLENYPVANQKLDITVFTEWNGTDELEIEYGKTITIVETNAYRRCIYYGNTTSNANRG